MRRALLLVVLAAGCSLESGRKPCGNASDCTLPFVCCTQGPGLAVQDFTSPTCLSRLECGPGNYLAFLPSGSPCGRVPGGYECGGALSCCDKTLTCLSGGDCTAAPFPPAASLAEGVACGADGECPGGVCCGVDFDARGSGRCQSIDQCLAGVGRALERPDAGPAGGDGGAEVQLAAQICERAYCGAEGPRAPTAEEQERCRSALELGEDGAAASQVCLQAVEDSRSFCAHALRPSLAARLPAGPAKPVLPGPCLGAPAVHPEAAAACAKLAMCGAAASQARCVELLAGLGYDTLSRISSTEGCAFELERLGWAPPSPSSRCREAVDCPSGNWACEPEATAFGLCRMRSCEPGACMREGGVCERGNCVERCTPSITERRRSPAVDALAGDCGGRINLSGRTAELACLQYGSGSGPGTGLCVPWPDLTQCAGSIERLLFEGRYASLAGYMCTATPTGTLAQHTLCEPPSGGQPDPCAEGACDPANRGCAYPCVALGEGSETSCGAGEVCVSNQGWGTPGFCYPSCASDAECPSNRCLDDPLAGKFCSSR